MEKIHLHSIPRVVFYFGVKAWRSIFFMPLIILALIGGFSLSAEERTAQSNVEVEGDETTELDNNYIGVFVGLGRAKNELTDVEGFANWGRPNSSVDYENTEPVTGLLIGKKVNINGIPLRLELDVIFGDMSASTNKLDPVGLDETAKADILWLVTARTGIEKDLGPVTVFANGGLAVARVSNSVIDIDFRSNGPPQKDPDDSFSDHSTRVGWVVGFGAEMPLDKTRILQNDEGWFLRLGVSYINLGKNRYEVNHSGNNSCGPEGPRKPCSYDIKNEVSIIRLVLVHRFL